MVRSLVDGGPAAGPEAQPIELVEIEPQATAALRVATTVEDMPVALGRAYDEIVAAITACGAEFAGPPYARYFAFGDGRVEAEVGFPFTGDFVPTSAVTRSELPGGRTATAIHVGSYEGIASTWELVQHWIDDRGLEVAGAPWEAYLTDPGTDPDPATWRTRIVFPVR